MATVCLVTTGHPSTNPRLVKEPDALAEAGYYVRVVAAKFWQWASEADAAFDNRPWPISYVRFGEMATGVGEAWIRVRQRAAREVAARVGPRELPKALLERAAHYVTVDLRKLAEATTADLYIAHNLGALPAAAAAAHRHVLVSGLTRRTFTGGSSPIALRTRPDERSSQRSRTATSPSATTSLRRRMASLKRTQLQSGSNAR